MLALAVSHRASGGQLDELKDEQGREERSDAERQDRDGLSFQQVAQATQRLGVEAWNGDLAAEAVNEKNARGEKQTTAHLRPKQRRKNIVCHINSRMEMAWVAKVSFQGTTKRQI